MKIRRSILGFCAAVVMADHAAAQPAAVAGVADPNQLQDWPLLFADDSGVASRSGLVRTVPTARTDPSPVLTADRPWEGGRGHVYGSAYRDESTGRYRMWYVASGGRDEVGEMSNQPPARRRRGGAVTLLANSADGVVWEKPSLNLYQYKGFPRVTTTIRLGNDNESRIAQPTAAIPRGRNPMPTSCISQRDLHCFVSNRAHGTF